MLYKRTDVFSWNIARKIYIFHRLTSNVKDAKESSSLLLREKFCVTFLNSRDSLFTFLATLRVRNLHIKLAQYCRQKYSIHTRMYTHSAFLFLLRIFWFSYTHTREFKFQIGKTVLQKKHT